MEGWRFDSSVKKDVVFPQLQTAQVSQLQAQTRPTRAWLHPKISYPGTQARLNWSQDEPDANDHSLNSAKDAKMEAKHASA